MGKNRDSNYIYGPAAPRTFFIGLKINSLLKFRTHYSQGLNDNK